MSPSVARYQLDADTYRVGRSALVFGGSPPRLFRLTDGGVRVFETVAAGRHVRPGPLVRRFLATGAIHPDVDVAGDVHDLDLATTSVVIPARNPCPVALAALVAALGAVHEIVVVDDGSTQPIAPLDGATVVRVGTPGGPASARNVGLERCTTEFVVFVDSDVSVDGTDAVATLLAHFVDESVVAVAPRVRSVPTPTILGSYEAANSPLDLGARPALVGPGRRVSYVATTMLATRADAVRAVDGFDESLRFGEDVDLVWRLVDAGGMCRYEPRAVVHHEPRRTWRAWARQRVDYGTSAAPLARRHPGLLPAVRLRRLPVATLIAAAIGARRTALLTAISSVGAMTVRLRRMGLPTGPAAVTSTRLALGAHVAIAGQLAEVVRRTWWPIALVASTFSRRARRVAAVAALAGATRSGTPGRLPLRLADDALYGLGVWIGVVREREWQPLSMRFGALDERAGARPMARYGRAS